MSYRIRKYLERNEVKIFIPIAAYLLLMPSISVACSCANFSLFTKWGMSKHVFLAQITHIEVVTPGDPYSGYSGKTRGFFNVKEVFKGSADDIPYLSASEYPSPTCSMNIEQGSSYYVFAEEEGPVEYNMCSLTTQANFFPYYGEVLRNLKNNVPVKTFFGTYNSKDDTLVINTEEKPLNVLEMGLSGYDFYRVNFHGYSLSDERIFATEIIDQDTIE